MGLLFFWTLSPIAKNLGLRIVPSLFISFSHDNPHTFPGVDAVNSGCILDLGLAHLRDVRQNTLFAQASTM